MQNTKNPTTREKLLEILACAGGEVSGEALAAELGISRAAVWKAVQALLAEGVPIEALPRRGYRLQSGGAAYLHEGRIRHFLTKEAAARYAIRIEDTLPSTNTVLKQLAAEGAPEGLVLIARKQTQGKGRLGRTFESPQGGGLYMSVLLRPRMPVEQAMRITVAAAVAVAEAIEAIRPGVRAMVKWVNDIYLEDRKVCGILTEAGMDFESGALAYAVLGIGVNLIPPEGGFPGALADIVGTVFPAGASADGNLLAAEILNRLANLTENPCSPAVAACYRSRSMLDGCTVLVRKCTTKAGEERPATVLYIDENTGLRVRYEDGTEETLSSGEVDRPSVHRAAAQPENKPI